MTQKEKFIYKNIILQSSFQTAGHVDDYFIHRTRYLIVIYCLPRLQNHTNDIYVYKKGNLIKIIHRKSSSNALLYYLHWFLTYWFVLITLCKTGEEWVVLAGHPIFFFFMFLQKNFRNIKFAYWIGDYFPGEDWEIRLYERLKKYYHDAIPITYYLSDRINSRMNEGIVLNSYHRRTVAWGMKAFRVRKKDPRMQFLAFVGVIKPSQNIEMILDYLYKNPSWNLKLIGVSEKNYYRKLSKIIIQYKLCQRVWFPNTFISEKQLQSELDDCLIGVALYKSDNNQFTWYTDPGKIKTYLEFGLPVIMTDSASIAKDISLFHCGEVMKKRPLDYYVRKVMINYYFYQQGIRNIIRHYEYLKYYDEHFDALRE
jgi:hypothetical protein